MPSFKPKSSKKIIVSQKNITTLDSKHKEFIKKFEKDDTIEIPKLKKNKKDIINKLKKKNLKIEKKIKLKDKLKKKKNSKKKKK